MSGYNYKNDGLLHKCQDELDKEKKFNKWLTYFSGYIYREHQDIYDKASKVAYQMLQINVDSEEGAEKREEILKVEKKKSKKIKKSKEGGG